MTTPIADEAVRKANQLFDEGAPQHKILSCIIDAAETVAGPGCACSILVLDKEGLLRNGLSPRLPFDYLTAIDGLKPHPLVGTCASAAARGVMVITRDFKSDDKWAELRHLPLALGYHSAWSMPIKKDTDGRIMGTFGTYYPDEREPSEVEIVGMKKLVEVAARVLA